MSCCCKCTYKKLTCAYSTYEICTFSVKVANQIFKDVAALRVQDGALVMLECTVCVVEYMGAKIPSQKLQTHLGALGYEKLCQKLVQKLVDKEQVLLYFCT